MEISELVLWFIRLLVLALMYLFLLVLVVALLADARAAVAASKTGAAPAAAPAPAPATPPAAAAPTAPEPLPMLAVSRLEVQSGTLPVTGRQYTLFGPLEIGRGAACDISIPNRFVSTRHARIFQHDGAWMLEDLGSTNGTLVNGERVDGSHPLTAGDRVMIGDTEFSVD